MKSASGPIPYLVDNRSKGIIYNPFVYLSKLLFFSKGCGEEGTI